MKLHTLMTMLACMVLLNIACVAAFEFDNVKQYDSQLKEVTVKDSVLGVPTTTVAKLQLLTPHSATVFAGDDVKVAEIKVTNFENNYVNPFKTMEFYTFSGSFQSTGHPIVYKFKSSKVIQVPDYQQSCVIDSKNGTFVCTYGGEAKTTHPVTVDDWVTVDASTPLPTGTYTLGLFTNVKAGERVEWIPTFFGVRINEWADFTGAQVIENYTTGDNTEAGTSNAVGYRAQTFTIGATPGINGNFTLAGAALKGYCTGCGGSAIFDFKIKNANATGSPVGSVIANGTYDINTLTAGGEWFNVTMAPNVTLNMSRNYSLYVYPPVGGTFKWRMNSGAAYSGGQVWYSNLDENAWEPNGGGAYMFQIWGTIKLPTTAANVTLLSPPNNIQYVATSANVTFNCTAADSNTFLYNLSLIIDNANNYTQLGDGSGNSQIIRGVVIGEGAHTWSCRAYNGYNISATASSRSFTIDGTPPVVNILAPINGSSTLGLKAPFVNVSFNASVFDNSGLSNCWYFNDSANVTIDCNNNVSVALGEGWHTLRYYANDTVGQITFNSTSFFIGMYNYTVEYQPSVIEGQPTTFFLNVTTTNMDAFGANMTYNNTNYDMFNVTSNATFARWYRTINASQVVIDTFIPFQMNFTIGSNLITTSSFNQLVYNIPQLNVSTNCAPATLNFTLLDEENLTGISGTFDYDFAYGLSNGTQVRTFGQISTVNATAWALCANFTIAPNWTLGSGQIFYSSPNYVARRYYLFNNTILTNNTNNIALHDLLSSSQTSFQLTVESTSLTPYVGKYTTLVRWYNNLNQYRVVDMGLTDGTGSTVIHVDAEDVDYRIGVYEQNGSLIKLADPIRMVCTSSPCTYTLKISPTDDDFSSFLNVQYNFDFNYSTNIWSFTYSDASQRTQSMNMTIYKDTGTGSLIACTTQVTGSSGAMTCNTTGYTGSLRGVVQRVASPPVQIVQLLIDLRNSAFASSFGLFLSILLAIPITFVFAMISPVAAIIGGVVALVPALYFGSVNFAIIGGMGVLGGIVAHFLSRL